VEVFDTLHAALDEQEFVVVADIFDALEGCVVGGVIGSSEGGGEVDPVGEGAGQEGAESMDIGHGEVLLLEGKAKPRFVQVFEAVGGLFFDDAAKPEEGVVKVEPGG